jgi:hypothetical protein
MARLPIFCDLNYRLALLALLVATAACGGELRGEVDGQRFVRCAQVRAPEARTFRAREWSFRVRERTLHIDGPWPLPVAAFTGPVGQLFTAADLAQLSADAPALALMLGGLGDDDAQAGQNLLRLAALHIPTVFIPGGADRRGVVDAAFAALPEAQRDWVLDGSGLRELRVGDQRLVIAAGAALGRYALDEQACGLAPDDFSSIQAALAAEPARRTYLLSWHAASGFGVSDGFGGASDLGSPDLMALGRALGASGGLFAFPEPSGKAASDARAWVVPRLGPPGTQSGDGARLHSRAGRWQLALDGLSPRP